LCAARQGTLPSRPCRYPGLTLGNAGDLAANGVWLAPQQPSLPDSAGWLCADGALRACKPSRGRPAPFTRCISPPPLPRSTLCWDPCLQAGGALIGPYALGIIQDVESIRHLAELGVVFLLFNIGLELSFDRLRSMQKYVFGMGTAQVSALAGGRPAQGRLRSAARCCGQAVALACEGACGVRR
jgi:hypothetical protein